MSALAPQPQVVRRHRQRGVLVEQRRQRVDVVALERVDVLARRSSWLVVGPRRADVAVVEAAARRAWPGPAAARCSPRRRSCPSSSATSSAFHRSTSRRISTARCCGGRCCRAPMNASRIDSLATATSPGSPSGTTRPSGIGSIHVASPRASSSVARSATAARRGPSGGPGAACCRACRGRRWWRCGTATSAATSGPRTSRRPSTPGPSSPARRPRPRTPSRASGSSGRSARGGTARAGVRAGTTSVGSAHDAATSVMRSR